MPRPSSIAYFFCTYFQCIIYHIINIEQWLFNSPTTTMKSNTWSAHFKCSLVIKSPTMAIKGIGHYNGINVKKSSWFSCVDAHWTQKVYSVYDPTNGHQLHGHYGGVFCHPCQQTWNQCKASWLATYYFQHWCNQIEQSFNNLVCVNWTCHNSMVCPTYKHIGPFLKNALPYCGRNSSFVVRFHTDHKVIIVVMGYWVLTCYIEYLICSIPKIEPKDCNVHNILHH